MLVLLHARVGRFRRFLLLFRHGFYSDESSVEVEEKGCRVFLESAEWEGVSEYTTRSSKCGSAARSFVVVVVVVVCGSTSYDCAVLLYNIHHEVEEEEKK